jgi:DNA invertase Pin-like site-specific DNA recombinase
VLDVEFTCFYGFQQVTFNNGANQMKYGYARVSTTSQDYMAQVEALKAAGCEHIFGEKASGKSTDGRPAFKKMMKALLPGDIVVVTKLDRLARSSRDLMNILHELEGLSVGFRSLDEAWCDTTTDIGKLLITVMSGIAQFERSLIRSRTDAGIERARKLGKKFGRKPSLDAGQVAKIAEFHQSGEWTMERLAEEYQVSVGTVWNAIHGGHKRPFDLSASA